MKKLLFFILTCGTLFSQTAETRTDGGLVVQSFFNKIYYNSRIGTAYRPFQYSYLDSVYSKIIYTAIGRIDDLYITNQLHAPIALFNYNYDFNQLTPRYFNSGIGTSSNPVSRGYFDNLWIGGSEINLWGLSDLNRDNTKFINVKKYIDSLGTFYYGTLAAIAALPIDGGTLYYPAGHYNLSAPVYISSGGYKSLTICGDGNSTVFDLDDDYSYTTIKTDYTTGDTLLICTTNAVFNVNDEITWGKWTHARIDFIYPDGFTVGLDDILYNSVAGADAPAGTIVIHSFCGIVINDSTISNLTIRDLQITGSYSNSYPPTPRDVQGLIDIENSSNVIIEKCYLYDSWGDAIAVVDANRILVRENRMEHCCQRAVVVGGWSSVSIVKDNHWSDCLEGIYFCQQNDSMFIDGNTGIDGEYGIWGIGTPTEAFNTITNNFIVGATIAGIHTWNVSENNVIKNNTILGYGVTGVRTPIGISLMADVGVEDLWGKYYDVQNNFISGCVDGIVFCMLRESNVSNNFVTNCTNAGIYLKAVTQFTVKHYPIANTIENNKCFYNKYGIYSDTTGNVDDGNYINNNYCKNNTTTDYLVIRVHPTAGWFEGQQWYDDSDHKMYVWDGSAWHALW